MRKQTKKASTPRRVTLLIFTLVLVFVFAGCDQINPTPVTSPTTTPTQTATSGEVTPEPEVSPNPTEAFAPFTPPIRATTFAVTDDTRVYPKGQTWDNNLWTQAYEKMLGVTFEYAWSGPAEDLKDELEVMASSGQLPDYMVLDYDTFYEFAQRGLLEPLDNALTVYSSPQVRTAMDAYDGAAMKTATLGGDLYGITGAPPRDGLMLWYRNDWFAATGRTTAPTTMEEVIEMAYDFAALKSGNLGFTVDKALFVGDNGAPTGLEGIFSAYGLYPTQWQEIDGALVHGSVNPENKQVLSLLQKCYKDGIISADFQVLDPWVETVEAITQDQVGLVFAPDWFSSRYAGLAVSADGDDSKTWTCMPIPGSAGATNRLPTKARQGDVTAVRAGYAYPELAVKMVNLTQSLLYGEMADSQYRVVSEESGYIDTTFMAMAVGGNMSDGIGDHSGLYAQITTEVLSAMAAGDASTLTGDAEFVYNRLLAWENRTDEAEVNPTDYLYYATYGPGGAQSVLADMRARNLLMADAYYGPTTQAMQDSWGTLMQKRNEMFARIIAGDAVDVAFEAYVEYFEDNGGQEITRQVNSWFEQLQ